ncbi:winged helix-turn-helix domain-containing protein [Streptomyces sp. PSKA01]|uniref:Winged helix-turn-helix domain-containing protein n=1 Tax=Streptomyces cupreus TaxID=2759956 RepID=A0A7X1JHH5_9ACTN|nr:winged helix-turn-helix domain-containing protein [Streptomyces cupreus]
MGAGPDLRTVIARRVDVRFGTVRTWRILHRMGFTVPFPAGRAAERDEDAVTGWTKESWPRVERGEGPGPCGCVSRTRRACCSGHLRNGPASAGRSLAPAADGAGSWAAPSVRRRSA